jgi:predicted AAA+ superfamily ATPase
MELFDRILSITLPAKKSIFLWGARQTGKSSYLKNTFKNSVYYDLLSTHEMVRLSKTPALLREELLAIPQEKKSLPIIIDEIQKVPDLLNEVHWLIENANLHFILCGSSARKLKTQATNLLGGRAWVYQFYPLVFPEVHDFSLLKALQQGLIPSHYNADSVYILDYLQAYVDLYLTDEIRNEGLVRNLAGFARFLDVAGLTNGEMINFSNIARDCGVDRLTVQSYYQILIDTMVGYFIYPYSKKIKRNLITSTPKFYFFDVGVGNYLGRQSILELSGANAGKAFEHYILMELIAYIGIKRKKIKITYWRTKTGLEVDFVIGDAAIAIEVKIAQQVHKEDLHGLIAFSQEFPNAKCIVVSQDPKPRAIVLENVTISILPWRKFLENLWSDKL